MIWFICGNHYFIMESKIRVAVIGAGPCGIYMTYQLKQLEDKITFEVFEKQDAPGGQWNFNPVMTDKYGQMTHSCTYDNLWINGPKEALEIPIYKFSDDIPSYFARPSMQNYVLSFIDHFDLRKYIKCGMRVENLTYNEEKKIFSLTKKNLETGESDTKEYDFVIVSTGHFTFPRLPTFPGEEKYTGMVFHSRAFRNEAQFKGKRILIVGGSYSAEDVAVQCYKFQAAKITIANRRKMGFKWPIGIEEKAFTEIKDMDGLKVSFTDGSEGEFDVFCKSTGFLHDFPFIDDKIKLDTPNIFNPPLYMQIVFPTCERLFYMGMQDQFYTFTMFYMQAQYIRDVINGKIKIPSHEEMHKWIEEDAVRAKDLSTEEKQIMFQTAYLKMLCDAVDEKQNLDVSK